MYQQLDEDEKAKEHYETALELQPDSGIIHNNYATLLCKMGKPLKAEPHFLKAINNRRYRTPAQALENLGSCLMKIPDINKRSCTQSKDKHYISLMYCINQQPNAPR